ncbi:hypothetical protein [Streptomyces sp. NPDC006274]
MDGRVPDDDPGVVGLTARLSELLGPYWVAVLGSGPLPARTTLGIGKV